MLRGRKRKLPSCYIPEPYYYGSESYDDEDDLSDNNEPKRPSQEAPVYQQDVQHGQEVQHGPEVQHGQEVQHEQETQEQEQPGQASVEESDQDEAQGYYVPPLQEPLERVDETGGGGRDHDVELMAVDVDLEGGGGGGQDFEQMDVDVDPDQYEHDNTDEDGDEEDEDDPDDDPDKDPVYPDDDPDEDNQQDYYSILDELSRKWMFTELDHTVSKCASNKFWKVAFNFIPKLIEAKVQQRISRKVPQFNHIRRTLENKNTPEVQLEIAYKKRDSEEIEVVNTTVTPRSQFPPHLYEKMYEVASVKVKTYF